jgi:hypothetical protein
LQHDSPQFTGPVLEPKKSISPTARPGIFDLSSTENAAPNSQFAGVSKGTVSGFILQRYAGKFSFFCGFIDSN